MNILIIGGGGREHTLAWKIKQSPHCDQLYIAPGNAGTSSVGINVPLAITDFAGIATFCLAKKINMVLVGPEEPLVKGIYDYITENPATAHIPVIGPSKEASRLEGSKAFAKAFMDRNSIPTAGYREFDATSFEEGVNYIRSHTLPVVLKADGLAAGKGVVICHSHIEALAEFDLMIQQSKFGEAGKRVVIEQFLEGIELSMFVLTDGKNYVLLPEAKDYKQVGMGNTGPNTGGMGAVSPVPFVDDAYIKLVEESIIAPTIKGLLDEKLVYKGVIFLGLINVKGKPYVIEYNCRLGDPETEVIIPRIENDLVEILVAVAGQKLNDIKLKISASAAVTVVAVSGGYPNDHATGKEVHGLEDALIDGSIIFHSGTKEVDGKVLTNGGRVLAITSFGDTIDDAAGQSNYILEQVFFDGIYFRNDIGFEFR